MSFPRASRGGSGPGHAHDVSGPARGDPDAPLCCVCGRPVAHPAWADGWCWTDPGGETVAAHGDCLRALGEKDLGLVDR